MGFLDSDVKIIIEIIAIPKLVPRLVVLQPMTFPILVMRQKIQDLNKGEFEVYRHDQTVFISFDVNDLQGPSAPSPGLVGRIKCRPLHLCKCPPRAGFRDGLKTLQRTFGIRIMEAKFPQLVFSNNTHTGR